MQSFEKNHHQKTSSRDVTQVTQKKTKVLSLKNYLKRIDHGTFLKQVYVAKYHCKKLGDMSKVFIGKTHTKNV